MRKIPPLNALKAFETAARHVSFTKAAEEMHVTHGAVSRQVSLLEEWLGTALFRRGASQVALTEKGRVYAQEITSLLDRLAVVTGQLTERSGPTTINVSAPPTFTMRWLIPRLSAYQHKRSDVEIRLTTSMAPVNFQENNYDIAIRGAQEPLVGCDSLPIMTETIVPICHVDLLEKGGLRTPSDLAKQTLIRYTTEPYPWSSWFEAAGTIETAGSSSLHFEQMFFALQAAAEGLGVVLVPLFLVADDIVTGKLCAPFGLLGAMQRHYFANTPKASMRNLVIAEFCSWLMEEGRSTEHAITTWANDTFAIPKEFAKSCADPT